MAIRKIHEVGDPCLTKVCRPVTEFNDRLHELLDDMADTLEEAGGVGLAAPQVGILRRVCIVEDEQGEIIELINPEIIKTEGEQTGHPRRPRTGDAGDENRRLYAAPLVHQPLLPSVEEH